MSNGVADVLGRANCERARRLLDGRDMTGSKASHVSGSKGEDFQDAEEAMDESEGGGEESSELRIDSTSSGDGRPRKSPQINRHPTSLKAGSAIKWDSGSL